MIECFNVNNGTIYFDKDNKEKPYYFVNKHDQKIIVRIVNHTITIQKPTILY